MDALARIWTELLGRQDIGPDDDFFALGGHSVTATRLTARVRRHFRVDLPVSAVFAAPTLSGLAARIATAEPVGPAPMKRQSDLSDIQRLQWFAEKLADPAYTAYTIPLTLRIRGKLDTIALRKALRDLVTRHQVLRTRFPERDGQPYAVVESPERFATAMLRMSADTLHGLLRSESRRPFRLDTDLPVRATICRLGPDDHVLAIVLHHIAADGWSRGLLLDDLAALYAFHRALRPAPPQPMQYAEVAGGIVARDRDLQWWVRQLHGAPSRTTFAASRPGSLSDAGASVPLPIPSDAVRSLGATSYAVCMAALVALLSHDSGVTDVVVATSVAGRDDPASEDVVGCFINTVAIRTDLSGNPAVRELLVRITRSTVDALDHPRVSFDQIVRELGPERDPAFRPLCQVMLTMHNEPGLRPALAGLDTRWIEVDNGGAKCDVFVDVTDDGGPLRGWLTYRTQLYDAVFANSLAARFGRLLSLMAADPDRHLDTLLTRLEEDHVAA